MRRLSEAEKDARGSHAARKNPPKPRRGTPKAPRWADLLGDPRAARDAARWWRETVPELERAGVLTRVDETVLIEAAVCVARIAQCERELGRSGLLVTGQKGNLVRNPVSLTLASYRQSLTTYLKHLGLSPLARQGMDTAPGDRQLTLAEKLAIVAACEKRGIGIDVRDLADDDWDLVVPDDIAAQYGR